MTSRKVQPFSLEDENNKIEMEINNTKKLERTEERVLL
jgi:hypothetical protein